MLPVMGESDAVLRVPEAAKLLKVTANTLRNWMREPGFPVIRIQGGHPRFLRDQLLDWMRQRSQRGDQSA